MPARLPERPWHLASTQHQETGEPVRPTTAVCFSVAGPPAEAQDPEGYSDDGTRHALRLDPSGTITLVSGPVDEPLVAATHRERLRAGEVDPGTLRFSLVAANGGRVFAKELGRFRFWLLATEDLDVVRDPKTKGAVRNIANAYFALDPQFNDPHADAAELINPLVEHHGVHPSVERFGLLAEVMEAAHGLGFQVVFVKPRVWHWLDTRPPAIALELGPQTATPSAPWWRALLNLDPLLKAFLALGELRAKLPRIDLRSVGRGLRAMLDETGTKTRGLRLRPTAEPQPPLEPIAGFKLVPVAQYERSELAFKFTGDGKEQELVDFGLAQGEFQIKSVLGIGVGHAHLHEQWETRYGGELQPLMSSSPLAQNERLVAMGYRFLNGPVQDGDGFIDGTCNYYALCELTPVTGATPRYGVLFTDEQSFFSGRWRLLHPSADARGMMFSLAADLADPVNAAMYEFDQHAFWSPFEAGCIDDRSRLAVSRQVVLVTGTQDGQAELYSLNFSWSTCDRTWRWRRFPATARYFPEGAEVADDGPLPVDSSHPDSVFPQTIRLREDMTLVVRGTRSLDGAIVKGRWFQKYLPASNQHVPRFVTAPAAGASARPAQGYSHAWDFLSEAAFQLADARLHFGVYEPVSSRGQYYRVEVANAASLRTLRAIANEDVQWEADPGALFINTLRFDWQTHTSDGVLDLTQAVTREDPLPWQRAAPSLYADRARLKLLDRGALGWLAVHADKRDDDLLAFSDLPRRVTLKHAETGETVDVILTSQVVTYEPPRVASARVSVRLTPGGAATAHLAFQCLGTLQQAMENVWRVRIAAVVDGQPRRLLDVSREQCSYDPLRGEFTCEWTVPKPEDAALLTAHGRALHATSVWFVDVVGHVATPEELSFAS